MSDVNDGSLQGLWNMPILPAEFNELHDRLYGFANSANFIMGTLRKAAAIMEERTGGVSVSSLHQPVTFKGYAWLDAVTIIQKDVSSLILKPDAVIVLFPWIVSPGNGRVMGARSIALGVSQGSQTNCNYHRLMIQELTAAVSLAVTGTAPASLTPTNERRLT